MQNSRPNISRDLRTRILRCWENGWQVCNIMKLCGCTKDDVRQALKAKGIPLKDGDEGLRQSVMDLED